MLKKIGIIFSVLLFGITAHAEEEPEQLYARSAVLMDADSGRVLFEKNGLERRAMASTTKIMTCILALERGNMEDIVTASSYAARQPKVHLGVQEGEQFRLEDLLYSLMLESHNDSAVMIAEHIAGSVEGFAKLMNEKAEELGCKDTYFITPNGLDAVDEGGKHATTAVDLAKMMSYCIEESKEKDAFIQITGTKQYSFSEVGKGRSFSCNNHNAFLTMMEGAFSGKTGFTGDAGYCYVGALRRDDRTFVVALLGCGWPNNKTYKWADTKKLMRYGLDNYTYKTVEVARNFSPIEVKGGIPKDGRLDGPVQAELKIADAERKEATFLLKNDEQTKVRTHIKKEIEAPIRKGEEVGEVEVYLGEELLRKYKVVTAEAIEKISFRWCLEKVAAMYSMG